MELATGQHWHQPVLGGYQLVNILALVWGSHPLEIFMSLGKTLGHLICCNWVSAASGHFEM